MEHRLEQPLGPFRPVDMERRPWRDIRGMDHRIEKEGDEVGEMVRMVMAEKQML